MAINSHRERLPLPGGLLRRNWLRDGGHVLTLYLQEAHDLELLHQLPYVRVNFGGLQS